MDGMIFAAGLGTRLRPLTENLPKALVPVDGIPMLERVARRLIAAGVDRLIVNVHYFPDRIEDFLEQENGFGVDVRVSREEEERLETGGGLLAAEEHFRKEEPFFLHNSDVISDISLEDLRESHLSNRRNHQAGHRPLVTLAVMERDASRHFLFDDDGLCGHVNHATGKMLRSREPVGEVRPLGFAGIHIAEPELFAGLRRVTRSSAFSIADAYLRLAGEGARILGHRVDDALWLDIGTPERLAEAEAAVTAPAG